MKCFILPINGSDKEQIKICSEIQNEMMRYNISNKIDSSAASIGKRYSRADELGVPFDITVDFETMKDNNVTIRERDSMQQVKRK